jgi:hypothetical protein
VIDCHVACPTNVDCHPTRANDLSIENPRIGFKKGHFGSAGQHLSFINQEFPDGVLMGANEFCEQSLPGIVSGEEAIVNRRAVF